MHIVIHVLVLSPFKEWSFDDTRVLLSWLKDGDGIISEIEGDNESSVDIFRDFSVESSSISEDLLIVINVLEEINLWFLGDKLVDVTEGINFITETIMWWNLHDNWVSWLWLLNVSKWEVSLMLGQVVVLGELVNTMDVEHSSVGNKRSIELNFIAGEISVSDELLSWLVYLECLWQLLSSEINSK